MTEAEQRAAVIAEARSWLGTNYHHAGRVKISRDQSGRVIDRGGVDCAMFLAEVYERVGVTSHIDVAHYPRDWHLHRKDERFLSYILPRAVEVEAPQSGDAVMYAIGLGFAHAGIVIDWPRIIHSDMDARQVAIADGTQGRHARASNGALRGMRFFSPWGAA